MDKELGGCPIPECDGKAIHDQPFCATDRVYCSNSECIAHRFGVSVPYWKILSQYKKSVAKVSQEIQQVADWSSHGSIDIKTGMLEGWVACLRTKFNNDFLNPKETKEKPPTLLQMVEDIHAALPDLARESDLDDIPRTSWNKSGKESTEKNCSRCAVIDQFAIATGDSFESVCEVLSKLATDIKKQNNKTIEKDPYLRCARVRYEGATKRMDSGNVPGSLRSLIACISYILKWAENMDKKESKNE